MATSRAVAASAAVLVFLAFTLAGCGGASPPKIDNAVNKYGQLKVSGNKVVGFDGSPAHLRGMSLFWSQWKPQFYNKELVHWLANDWQATLVRAAMGVENDGYLVNPDAEKKRVEAVVDGAIEAGIYVLI